MNLRQYIKPKEIEKEFQPIPYPGAITNPCGEIRLTEPIPVVDFANLYFGPITERQEDELTRD